MLGVPAAATAAGTKPAPVTAATSATMPANETAARRCPRMSPTSPLVDPTDSGMEGTRPSRAGPGDGEAPSQRRDGASYWVAQKGSVGEPAFALLVHAALGHLFVVRGGVGVES